MIDDADVGAGELDTILYTAGVNPNEVVLSRTTTDLVLSVLGTNDKITVSGHFLGSANQIDRIEFADGTIWNESLLASAKYLGGAGSDSFSGTDWAEWFEMGDGDDGVSAGSGNDTIFGGSGNDSLWAGDGNDALYGGSGVDSVNGGNGNDTLDGGTESDVLDGSTGDDVYNFRRGYGHDRIMDYDEGLGNIDSIVLASDIASSDVALWRDISNLYLGIKGTEDVIEVQSWFDSSANRVEQVLFSGGDVWSASILATAGYIGSSLSDFLSGTDQDEKFEGMGGNDSIFGLGGMDVLDGGIGNDLLDGGAGNDLYLFQHGDGQDTINDYDIAAGNNDTIRFGTNISESDVVLWRDVSSLHLRFADSNDSITVQDWFSYSESRVELVEFADGTVWNTATLANAPFFGTVDADYLNGTIGNDRLYGFDGADTLTADAGNDTLEGGGGNDQLDGGAGNDSFVFNLGFGQDSVTDVSGTDIINLGAGLSVANVQAWRDTSSLHLSVVGTTDVITVQGWFDLTTNRVESVQFDDGTIWNTATLASAPFFGTAGADYLPGTIGNDRLYGFDEADVLMGDAGNDTLEGGTGNDQLDGGAGDDSFVFNLGFGQDNVADAAGTDIIKLGAGLSAANVQAWRDTSNLYLSVVGSTDVITVQGWFDLTTNRVESVQFADGTIWNTATLASAPFFGTAGADYLPGTIGNDRLYGFDEADVLMGDAGNDTLEGGTGNDQLDGGAGDDSFVFNLGFGQDNVADAAGTDIIKLGAGLSAANVQAWRDTSNLYLSVVGTTDVITVQGWFDLTTNRVESVQFDDGTIWNTATLAAAPFFGTAGADYLYGTTGNDKLYGFDGADTLMGDAGNDTLEGGTGNDSLYGGDGNDTYLFGLGGGKDVISETTGTTDIVRLGAGISTSDIRVSRDASNLYLTIRGTNDSISVQSWFADAGYKVEQLVFDDTTMWTAATLESKTTVVTEGDDFVWGTTGADTISGLGGDDELVGNEGNDTLTGGAGNDTLIGGSGIDWLVGGIGDDSYVIDSASDVITELAGEGMDTVRSNLTYTLGNNLESLVLVEAGGAINGTGNSLDNTIWGNSAANTLNGGVGADTLIGGVGNDIYVIDNASDSPVENAGEGTDTVQSSISYGLVANIENLTLTGTGAINGTGNELNNSLVGNSAANTLDGGQGNDSLNGGAGADTLIGGLGNDSYTVDNSGDVVIEYAGEGTDTVSSSISYVLGSELENLTLTGSAALSGTGNALNNSLTGNSGANLLTGGAGNDSLNGGAGADTLIGGMGNDSYTIDNLGDQVQEVLDEGIDLVNSGVTFVLGANLENLTLTGTAAINGTGNDLANTLVGNSAANMLTGGAGNDILNGSTGIDTLIGGTGDDAYTVDVAGDVVQESFGEGVDTINSAVSWALGANVENLSLTGSAANNATGNGADNVLIGNSGANTLTGFAGNDWLDGGAGNDSLVGGLGDDTYVVAQAADVVTEALDEGIDTVRSSVTWTLGANLETLILTGVTAINGTGNAQDNALYGNTASNALNGGAGADTMAGGQGNDTYTVDNAGDLVIELSGEGVDTVRGPRDFASKYCKNRCRPRQLWFLEAHYLSIVGR